MRFFAAVDPSDRLRELFYELSRTIRSEDHDWAAQRWIRPESYHVTVRFFGDLPSAACEAVAQNIQERLADFKKFELPIAHGVTEFPNARKVALLVTTFDDPVGDFARIKTVVEGAGISQGIPPDNRETIPHLTLVRAIRGGIARPSPELCARAASHLIGQSISVDTLSLYSSKLGRGGPRYTVEAKIRLRD